MEGRREKRREEPENTTIEGESTNSSDPARRFCTTRFPTRSDGEASGKDSPTDLNRRLFL